MSFLSLCGRVLAPLRPVKATAATLVAANLGLATAQFAEPLLYGKVIDQLAGGRQAGLAATWSDVAPLLAAWTGFAMFSIAAGILIALHADRLAHSPPRRGHGGLTIRNADRIRVFDNGEIVESGTFEEVVAGEGVFARLAQAQFMQRENEPAAL